MKDVKSFLIGRISVENNPSSPWKWRIERETPGEGVEVFRFKLTAKRETMPEKCSVSWKIPAADIHCRWTPNPFFDIYLPPEWAAYTESTIAQNMPLMLFGATGDENRFLFAVSEAKKQLRFRGGLREEDHFVHCKTEFFTHADAPVKEYAFSLRFDARKIFYADAVYMSGQCVEIPSAARKSYIINASESEKILVFLPGKKQRIILFDICGKKRGTRLFPGGWRELAIPVSGMAAVVCV